MYLAIAVYYKTSGKLAGAWKYYCIAGIATTDLIGNIPGLENYEVWFHPKGIANVLSLAMIKEDHRVTYNIKDGNRIRVHKTCSTTRDFHQLDDGLYHHMIE